MLLKTIICLANSNKPPSGGRCIAGKEISDANISVWIRPVSTRERHEVSDEERTFENGQKIQLLDIVSIPLIEHSPNGHQIENHTIDNQCFWKKLRKATWNEVEASIDHFDELFWGNSSTSSNGENDRVSQINVLNVGSSLKLIYVMELIFHVQNENFDGNTRRRVRTTFTYNNTKYKLSVTDPVFLEEYLNKPEGDYQFGEAALCVSLAEVWKGFSYRVVASVITPKRCETND